MMRATQHLSNNRVETMTDTAAQPGAGPMNKRERVLLEMAFAAEIRAALEGGPHIMQARGKLVEKLVQDGMLRKQTVVLGGRMPVRIEGYELTELGRFSYCMGGGKA